ncbi:hypothetical protein MSAN_01074000 [Mycena sanguinolenta]|uniref:Uncharacterized protein n=1 Tax=Mycena sanguinolenta TaxID=230812 RepID=A0A8H6YQ47_9AGAR|nr:hypothetical protein MSAN_01074000 [Mycena sanguinolenta]
MPLSLSAVNLITLSVGTLFYGIYLVLFSISLYLFLRRYNTPHTSYKLPRSKSIFRSTVFVSAICLFVVVTAHWTTIVYQAFIAFLAYQQGAEAEAFLNDHTQVVAIVQNSLMPIAILIGDCLIIHPDSPLMGCLEKQNGTCDPTSQPDRLHQHGPTLT